MKRKKKKGPGEDPSMGESLADLNYGAINIREMSSFGEATKPATTHLSGPPGRGPEHDYPEKNEVAFKNYKLRLKRKKSYKWCEAVPNQVFGHG